MRDAIRIARLGRIELRLDPSWLFIFVLIAWSLGTTFAHWHPAWSTSLVAVTALAAALVFFASVLAHELAHSLVAQAYGIPVRNITLHMFGGVSNIEKEPPSPGAELLIALVGPITSLALGVSMTVLGTLVARGELADVTTAADAAHALGPVPTLLLWAGPVNVMLGLFNLLPGLPLDGGRILRAILWRARGDMRSATRTSAVAGQLIGWALIVAGVFMVLGLAVPFFGRGAGSGLWLLLIGWFLRGAAVASFRASIVEDLVDGVHVGDLMRRTGPWLPSDAPLAAYASEILWRGEHRAYPIFQAGKLVGLVSASDVRNVPTGEWRHALVSDIMTPVEKLTSTSAGSSLLDAIRLLQAVGVKQLPVVREDGSLEGMLHERDIMRWIELTGDSGRGTPRAPRPRNV